MKIALGIDIGGTKISYALVRSNGEIVSDVEKISTPKTSLEIETKLKEIISKFSSKIEFVSIATAGAVNNENTCVIGSTANLPDGYKDISGTRHHVFSDNRMLYNGILDRNTDLCRLLLGKQDYQNDRKGL